MGAQASKLTVAAPPARRSTACRNEAVIPGGVSVPIQNMEEAEATLMDYEGFVERGDHQSLLGRRGAYARLHAMQFRERPRAETGVASGQDEADAGEPVLSDSTPDTRGR